MNKLLSLSSNSDDLKLRNVTPCIIDKGNADLKYIIYVRQYFPFTLNDRIASKPYLTVIDKKWIVFQLLYSYYQLIKKYKYHGDINFDNILISTNMTVYLTDIAYHKPQTFNSDDFTTLNNWFSNEYNEIKPIYFAPEKLRNDPKEVDDDALRKMDIFSLGIVIGQLFLEDTFFTRIELMYYKSKGILDNEFKKKMKRIKDNYNEGKEVQCDISRLLNKMLEVDPHKRATIEDCLNEYCNYICPMPIPRVMLYMNYIFNWNCQQGDYIIAKMYKHWKQIYSLCYEADYNQWNKNDNNIPHIKGNLHYNVFKFTSNGNSFIDSISIMNSYENNGIQSKLKSLMNELIPIFRPIFNEQGELDPPLEIHFSSEGQYAKLSTKSECMTTAKESGYIFLNFIFHALQNVKYDSSILIALEMIYHFSKNLSSNINIEFVLPHIVSLFSKENTIIKISALKCLCDILNTKIFLNLKLKLIDSSYFRSYIFPKIVENFNSNGVLRKYFFSILDKLSLFHIKFLKNVISNQVKQQQSQESMTNLFQSTIGKKVNLAKGETGNIKLKPYEIIKLHDKEMKGFYEKVKDAILLYIMHNKTQYDIEAIIELIKVFPKVLIIFNPSSQIELQKHIFDIVYKCYTINEDSIQVIMEMIKIIPKLTFMEYNIADVETILNIGLTSENEMCIMEAVCSTREFIFKLTKMDISKYIQLIQNMLCLVKHPNYQIRKETKMFFKKMISYFNENELNDIKQNNNLLSIMNQLFPDLHNAKYEFNDMFIDNMFNAKMFCPKPYYDLYMFKEHFSDILNKNFYPIIHPKETKISNDSTTKLFIENKRNALLDQIVLKLPLVFNIQDFMFLKNYLFKRYVKGTFYGGECFSKGDNISSNAAGKEMIYNEKINIAKINEIYYKNNKNENETDVITNEKIQFINNFYFDKKIANYIISKWMEEENKNNNIDKKGQIEGYLISFCSIKEAQIVNLINDQFNLMKFPRYVEVNETNNLPYCLIKFVISIIYKQNIKKQNVENKIYIMTLKLIPFYRIKNFIYDQLLKYENSFGDAISYFKYLYNKLNPDNNIKNQLSLHSFLFQEYEGIQKLPTFLKFKYYLYALDIKLGYQLIANNTNENDINNNISQSALMSTYLSSINKPFTHSLISSFSSKNGMNSNNYLDRYNSKTVDIKEDSWENTTAIYTLNIKNNSESIVRLLKLPSYTISNTMFNKANNYNLFVSVSEKGNVYIHYLNDNLVSTSITTDTNIDKMSLSTRSHQINNLQRNHVSLVSPQESKHACNDIVIAANGSNIHFLVIVNQFVSLCKPKHDKLITCISPSINSEYDLLLLANHDCSLSLFDMNNKSIVQTYNYYNNNIGHVTSILHQNNTMALLGTSLGYVLEYDYRLNMIVNRYSFANQDRKKIKNSIDGLLSFKPPKHFYHMNEYDFIPNHDYCFLYLNDPTFNMCLWDVTANKNKYVFTNVPNSCFHLNEKGSKCLFNRQFSYYDNLDDIQKIIENSKIDIPKSDLSSSKVTQKNFYVSFEVVEDDKGKVNCACVPNMTNENCNKAYVITGGDNEIRSWSFENPKIGTIRSKEIIKNTFMINDFIMLDNLFDDKKFLISADENGSLILYENNTY